ncbi:MAG: DUF2080 family transposase-associated protein [archaeon]
MRKFKYNKDKFSYEDEIEYFFEKKITTFGNGAKIDAPKEHIGKRVIVLVCKN